MAISKPGLMLYLTLVCATIVVFTSTLASAQCQEDMQGLITQCGKYVTKLGPKETPSQDCCNVVQNLDFTCVCQHVTPQIEQIISMEKAIFVATSCGKSVPHGAKCGSYTVPPS
ncbi:hypothetical protein ACS0TY_008092 [Phlomoides rotata]